MTYLVCSSNPVVDVNSDNSGEPVRAQKVDKGKGRPDAPSRYVLIVHFCYSVWLIIPNIPGLALR